ncbi:MAG TPA: hypothetical protein VKU60_17810 [Chloroflexota bacterium]|nr:hypothetical protein [Chloroflexota bacterium]
MLPEKIDPKDCRPVEDGRANHWIHKPTGDVFSMYPGWPNAPAPAQRDLFATEPTVRPAPVAAGAYIVVLPNGKKVKCADEASADALLEVMGVTCPEPSAAAGPTPEEIAAHRAQIAAEEAADQAEIDEARKRLEARYGLGPEETAPTDNPVTSPGADGLMLEKQIADDAAAKAAMSKGT